VLNHTNMGVTAATMRAETAAAVGYVERLFPRLVTAGVRLEF
jgi:hypothetical protein